VTAGLLDTDPLLWALAADERLAAWLSDDIERDATGFGVSDTT
jgi:PIN domain nuclease of toxin-antitoxin system